MDIKDTLNQIGKVFSSQEIDAIVHAAINKWNSIAPQSSWWNIGGGVSPVAATNFLITCLDELIVHMVQVDIPGPDKKATVIAAIDKIYAAVVVAMPLWMKPFSGAIQDYAVNVLASAAIDWIVAKYNNGQWSLPTPPNKTS